MKIFPVILLQCLTTLTSASTQEAYIYTHDVRPRSYSHPNTISPETAYSIWIRRLGLSERRRLLSVEASVLEEIDMFGGYQPMLFGGAAEQMKPSRLSIVIEGFDDGGWSSESLRIALADTEVSDVAGLEHYSHFAVAEPSQELASGLKTKSLNADRSSGWIFNWTFATKDKLNVFLELKFEVCTHTKVFEIWRSYSQRTRNLTTERVWNSLNPF
jgi:hypothetical protein